MPISLPLCQSNDISSYAKRTVKDYNFFRHCAYRCIRTLMYGYMKVFMDAKIMGRENLPDHPHFIVAANHRSNMDPFVVGTAVSDRFNVAFMGKQELFESWKSRWLMDAVGVFSVNRAKVEIATIRTAKEVLKTDNWCLGIFPEGTRVKDGESREAKKGVAFMAKATQAPVLPVVVVPRGDRDQHITINIGPAIPYNGEDVDTFTDTLMNILETLKREALAPNPVSPQQSIN